MIKAAPFPLKFPSSWPATSRSLDAPPSRPSAVCTFQFGSYWRQAKQAQTQLKVTAPPTGAGTYPALAETQGSFAAGLLTLNTPPGLKAPEQQAGSRFARYAGTQQATWERTLAAAYPVLKRLVGEAFFSGLAAEYGRQVPTQDPDRNRFGAGFGSFLQQFEPTQAYPYFPDVAALEWALHSAYYAADGAPLTLPELLKHTPEQLERLKFQLQPGLQLLHSPYAIGTLWEVHQQAGEVQLPELAHPCWLLVSRRGFRPQVQALSASSFAFLEALAHGHSLGVAMDAGLSAATQESSPFDLGAQLRLCISEQLLERIDVGTDSDVGH